MSGGTEVVPTAIAAYKRTRFRLCGGWADSDGRLEISEGDSGWQTVCSKHFNVKAANAICKKMGFTEKDNHFFDTRNSYYRSSDSSSENIFPGYINCLFKGMPIE